MFLARYLRILFDCLIALGVEKNLEVWAEMVKGTEVGQKNCLRAKIDYAADNGCLRDPVFYRCKGEPHLVTGDRFK